MAMWRKLSVSNGSGSVFTSFSFSDVLQASSSEPADSAEEEGTGEPTHTCLHLYMQYKHTRVSLLITLDYMQMMQCFISPYPHEFTCLDDITTTPAFNGFGNIRFFLYLTDT